MPGKKPRLGPDRMSEGGGSYPGQGLSTLRAMSLGDKALLGLSRNQSSDPAFL